MGGIASLAPSDCSKSNPNLKTSSLKTAVASGESCSIVRKALLQIGFKPYLDMDWNTIPVEFHTDAS